MSVLSIIYNDKIFVFESLQNNSFASILSKNIKTFTIEMCKVANGMSLRKISEVLQLRDKSYRSVHFTSHLTVLAVRCNYNNKKTNSYVEKIWEIVLLTIRQRTCLSEFNKLCRNLHGFSRFL